MTEFNQIIIDSEDSAWKVLQLAIANNLPEDGINLVFENWPIIDIKVIGEKHHASLTAKNMEGLLELQKTINRSYALLVYNSPNSANLKKDEREQLELVFNISPGSSEILAKLEKQLDTFTKGMVEKMEPKHFVICVLSAGLLWTGNTCWSTWLQHQKEIKVIETTKDTRQFASEQEFKKMQLIAQVAGKIPIIQDIKETSEEMYNNVLKSVSTAEMVSIAGVEKIPGETVKKLIKPESVKAKEIRLDGTYRILKVDSSMERKFRVHVLNLDTQENFSAIVQESFVTAGKHKELLQDAEWNKKPVVLQINAKKRKGSISSALIIGVEKAEEKIAQK